MAATNEAARVKQGRTPPETPATTDPEPSLDLPAGRAVGDLDRSACLALLEEHGVEVEVLAEVNGVEIPVRLRGPIRGIAVDHRGRSEVHSVLDCRLVLAILGWTPHLRQAGVTRLLHYSVYRPNSVVRGTGARSGHASAMAIDVGVVELEGDRSLEILESWTDRRRDIRACPPPGGEESEHQALLRGLVCGAVDDELFQIVLTPHHDDRHRNHLHLEVRPGVDWSLVD
ncbi:MAG: extensin family protein [Myxococcota bacterium]